MRSLALTLLHRIFVLIPLALSVVGIVLIFSTVQEIRFARQSHKWPKAEGHITSSNVKILKSRSSTMHRPNIKYRYFVDGTKFENDKILFGQDGTITEQDAKEKSAHYYVQRRVMVFYNPQRPNISCLELNTINKGIYWRFPIGVLLIVAGLFFSAVLYPLLRRDIWIHD